jgi:hypothetical protein
MGRLRVRLAALDGEVSAFQGRLKSDFSLALRRSNEKFLRTRAATRFADLGLEKRAGISGGAAPIAAAAQRMQTHGAGRASAVLCRRTMRRQRRKEINK